MKNKSREAGRAFCVQHHSLLPSWCFRRGDATAQTAHCVLQTKGRSIGKENIAVRFATPRFLREGGAQEIKGSSGLLI